jgi:hypothetical protein
VASKEFDFVPNGHEQKSPRWEATGLVRQLMLTTARPRFQSGGRAQLTLGDIVDAVMHFTTDSREAAMVVDDLIVTGRIRFKYSKGMSPDAQFGSSQCSGDTR